MNIKFPQRVLNLRCSFIRDILKVTERPEVISFAGGLPNPNFFPVDMLAESTQKVFRERGPQALQYCTTQGNRPLREMISQRYQHKYDLSIDPDEILITNGSQQALELLGKLLLDTGDRVIIEQPSYLGAIQAFSLYQPNFVPVNLMDEGLELNELANVLQGEPIKLCYLMPNFQNPSGMRYSLGNRQAVVEQLTATDTLLIEDDPYNEIYYGDQDMTPMRQQMGDACILLGSFSKAVAPGLRMGWICAAPTLMERLITIKQASDLHSNHLAQQIIYQFLMDHDYDAHLGKIRAGYQARRDLMVNMVEECFPAEVSFNVPEGGMFLWLTLPEHVSAMALFEAAIERNVAFVPGQPFYIDGSGENTLRLNFSNAEPSQIEQGMLTLAETLRGLG